MTFGGRDRRIPSLREVFEQFPEVPINVDIKVDSDELIRKVCERAAENCLFYLLINWHDLVIGLQADCLYTGISSGPSAW